MLHGIPGAACTAASRTREEARDIQARGCQVCLSSRSSNFPYNNGLGSPVHGAALKAAVGIVDLSLAARSGPLFVAPSLGPSVRFTVRYINCFILAKFRTLN